MPAPAELLDLIERFNRLRNDDQFGSFNETQLRNDYLNPMFELLGWDMMNRAGYAEKYRDVIHEAQVKVGGVTKAPDYCFKIGPERKFFLEAKRPTVKIKTDAGPAFQLRRYAWSAKLPLSVLSDFEEFAVYDCRIKPDRLDRASVGRIMYFDIDQLAEKWDEFAAIFSKAAVMQGSFDRYAESSKNKKGTAEVDDAFLDEIESWREFLAKDIAKNNPTLSQSELNDSVQRTIDRIIFLRICEDRGIEEYGRLLTLKNGNNVYPRLMQFFHQADARYNSGLFHFQHERGEAEGPDELTPELEISDKWLKEIIRRVYIPDSPYEFAVFPASILGRVYEQFLGRVITLDTKHRATIEEKPEVRKAGGVYYTPEYIAQYIVKNTVGKLVEGKTPNEVAKLRILDPACGSGSFLLVAYSFLLEWHLHWYSENNPEQLARKRNPPIYQATTAPTSGDLFAPSTANWRLTTGEKKRILLNNIYGVDIDRQAVEVTKLSLLLKLLEGENNQTLGRQLALLHERVLPDLGNNIKCGNSLIGSDFYDDSANMSIDLDERTRINAFDWDLEFPEILKDGGFDSIIGNPPYVRIQTTERLDGDYFSSRYQAATGNYDIYCLFIERCFLLSSANCRLGFILPHRFLKTDYGKGLREILSERYCVEEILDFDGFMVFEDASINTCIISLTRSAKTGILFGQVRIPSCSQTDVSHWLLSNDRTEYDRSRFKFGSILTEDLKSDPWSFVWEDEQTIWNKLSAHKVTLADITTHIFQGLKTGADTVFIGDQIELIGPLVTIHSKHLDRNVEIELELTRPLIKGGEMKRYSVGQPSKRVIFPYVKGELIPEEVLIAQFPKTWQYLCACRGPLENRDRGKMKGSKWFGYSRNQALDTMWRSKIITPEYYAHASYCLDKNGTYYFSGGGAGGYGIVLVNESYSEFVLGLLNSRLIDWYLKKISMRAYSTAYMYVKKYIAQLPIRLPDVANKSDQSILEKMNHVVPQIISLKQHSTTTSQNREFVARQINQLERQIDRLVYELYKLTEDEIAIVEGVETENSTKGS